MEKEQIEMLNQIIDYEYENMAGMIILKDDHKVYEHYAHGCTKDSTLHVFSITKSIVSILIGIALDQGYLTSLDQKVIDFFPESDVSSQHIAQVTIKDILTMRAAYSYKEGPKLYMTYFMSKDWVKFTLKQLAGTLASGDFYYAALVGPDLLTGILTKVTGKSVLTYANEVLFEPLNIHVKQPIVFKNAKEQRQFQKATDLNGWVSDEQGTHSGGWGLTLTCEALSKLGQLYLNGGKWKNQQIVSTSWVEESIQEHNRWKEIDQGYGYLWWINDKEGSGFAAMGDGGNILYVNKAKQLVVASTSLFVPKIKDRIELIKQEIEPYI